MQSTGPVQRNTPISRRGALGLCAIAIVSYIAGVYSKEISLAWALCRYEGGVIALSSTPLRPHLVGWARGPSLPPGFQALADSGNMRIAASSHRNGCFVLEAAGSPARFSIFAPGFQPIRATVDARYYSVLLTVSPMASDKAGNISVLPISAWEFIRRTVACNSSPV
jgi:hypothetical protein